MAETLTIRTASSTEVVKIAVPGPQGPKGDKGDPGDVAGLPLSTLGDTLYRGASENQRLPIGTSGQILRVSAGGIPEWGAAPATGVTSVALASTDLTISGSPITTSGTITANIAANAVTLEKLQTISSEHLLGRHGNGNGGVQQVGLGTGLAMSGSNIQCTVTAPTASSATPSALGTAAAGIATDYARADHVHSAEVSDSAFRVTGSTDATKKVAIEVDTNVPSGQTVTLTAPSSGGTIALAGAAPAAHASTHHTGGTDAIAPDMIGAQSIFTTTTLQLTANITLSAARAAIYQVISSGTYIITLPTSGHKVGDIVVIRGTSVSGSLSVTWGAGGQPVANNSQYRFIATGTGATNWSPVLVDTHTHAAADITSGTLAHERGGLEADVSAYNGLVKISGGSTSAVGIGTGSTEVAAGDHGHGNITSDGKLGSTAGLPVVTTTAGAVTTLALGTANQVLRVNSGATGVEFADPAASGVTGAAASASDVLGVSGANITGVDATADRIVFWDDSASALKYLEAGSGLSISGTTLSATASGGSKTYAVFTAEHNQPPSTAFATLDTRNSIAVLDFDAATDENAVFVGIMPEAASLGSGLIVRLHWMATSATSGNVRWGVQFERSNTDLDTDSFDTAVEATAATNGTSGIITTTAITVTTIDGITAGDVFRLKVFRNADDATNDTMTGDAELVAVEVRSAA